ncbi:MAG: hypothetical protein IT320_04745 [Anaerolineae bacterium]|nr:hypothetical protein [Anaerolineae bacterium]
MLSLEQILIGGAALSLAMGILTLASLSLNPRIWLNDYPEEIKKLAAPLSTAEKRQQIVFLVPILLAYIAVPLLSTVGFLRMTGDTSFLTAYGHAFLVLNIANLFDAVVIDWLFLYVMKPRFAIIPEAWAYFETMNIGWQARNYVKGIVFCAVFALPVALVATLL